MHVFIDTNILLNFFCFSKDELDALNNVFASHKHGSAQVHLTQQVCDEFKRNRERKIKDALKRFNEAKFNIQLPSFMKGYEEFSQIKTISNDLQQKSKAILKKVYADISANNLIADRLIGEIFERSKPIETSKDIFSQASKRMAIGNPPGKNKSIGDAINWTALLISIPDGEDLHIISEDGDFYSCLNEEAVHPFLVEEWQRTKNSKLNVYRTLSTFMGKHFDGVAFSFDKDKEALIEDLKSSGSFSETHGLIGKLDIYPYFSLKEVERILRAASDNDQFGMIVTDSDISDFLNKVAVPRIEDINDDAQKEIIKEVIKKQKNRQQ